MYHLRPHHRLPCPLAPGFTLVELMISIALVLLLVAGINAVFQAASQTTGTGMAVEDMTRSIQATERILNRDFAHAVPIWEMPALTIHSMQQYAFKNRADLNADNDNNPVTMDVDGSPNNGDEFGIPPITYNDRNHRVDRIAFFARNLVTPFERQTSDPAPLNWSGPVELITPGTSSEAWIWYGHLRLPTPSPRPRNTKNKDYLNLRYPGNQPNSGPPGDYFDPGEADPQENRNNFFSDDWALGRMAILLQPLPDPDNDFLRPSDDVLLSPLGRGSTERQNRYTIEHARIDLARTSIKDFRLDFRDAPFDILAEAFDFRFHCKPWVARGTLADNIDMGEEIALTVPFLQRGVSQFIVEFAGDFISQDPITGLFHPDPYQRIRPDGRIDFVMVPDLTDPTKATKQIRWYGMPRNVDPYNDNNGPSIPTHPNAIIDSYDVIPLRDVIGPLPTGVDPQLYTFDSLYLWDPHQKSPVQPIPRPNDYAKLSPFAPRNLAYTVAWSANKLANPAIGKPSMIRIIMTVTDANGRLPDGQTVEYIFTLSK